MSNRQYQINSIICAVDFTDAGEEALRYASLLAQAAKAELLITHVTVAAVRYEKGVPQYLRTPDSLAKDSAQLKALEPLVSEVKFQHHHLMGDPADEIVRLATSKGVDLIVMGTHARKGIKRVLMGSVAEQVLREAPCPVLTIRGNSPEE